MSTVVSTIPITTQTMVGAVAPTGPLQNTNPTATASSCQVYIPDYNVLRKQNVSKINEYYNNLLTSYTKNYTDYTTQSVSSNVNDRTYANTTLKPKVADYNTQVINVSQSYINNINQDVDLILEQKNQLQSKTTKIDTLIDNIKLLKDNDTDMRILTSSREDNLNSTKTSTGDMQFNTYIYIGICILLVLSIIGLMIYLVYSGYSKSSQNNNNLYKNIKTKNNTV